MGTFNHPNIVKIKEMYITPKQQLCIVMEYAECKFKLDYKIIFKL
jgi:hypothetical protein